MAASNLSDDELHSPEREVPSTYLVLGHSAWGSTPPTKVTTLSEREIAVKECELLLTQKQDQELVFKFLTEQTKSFIRNQRKGRIGFQCIYLRLVLDKLQQTGNSGDLVNFARASMAWREWLASLSDKDVYDILFSHKDNANSMISNMYRLIANVPEVTDFVPQWLVVQNMLGQWFNNFQGVTFDPTRVDALAEETKKLLSLEDRLMEVKGFGRTWAGRLVLASAYRFAAGHLDIHRLQELEHPDSLQVTYTMAHIHLLKAVFYRQSNMQSWVHNVRPQSNWKMIMALRFMHLALFQIFTKLKRGEAVKVYIAAEHQVGDYIKRTKSPTPLDHQPVRPETLWADDQDKQDVEWAAWNDIKAYFDLVLTIWERDSQNISDKNIWGMEDREAHRHIWTTWMAMFRNVDGKVGKLQKNEVADLRDRRCEFFGILQHDYDHNVLGGKLIEFSRMPSFEEEDGMVEQEAGPRNSGKTRAEFDSTKVESLMGVWRWTWWWRREKKHEDEEGLDDLPANQLSRAERSRSVPSKKLLRELVEKSQERTMKGAEDGREGLLLGQANPGDAHPWLNVEMAGRTLEAQADPRLALLPNHMRLTAAEHNCSNTKPGDAQGQIGCE
ncbi:hypothetical protein T439DRAFT_336662 [Meredithblackwellia eburnea MCA 4105]